MATADVKPTRLTYSGAWIGIILSTLLALVSWQAWPHRPDTPSPRGFSVPTTISSEAQAFLRQGYARRHREALVIPPLVELEARDLKRRSLADGPVALAGASRHAHSVSIRRFHLAGVPLLDIQPVGGNSSKMIVYFHGGGFVMGSAEDSLPLTIRLAEASGVRVVSVNYTTAPFARWRTVTKQALAVVVELTKEYDRQLSNIALAGDSAGANIALTTALQLRDLGHGLPAAIALWSPWTDLDNTGDTHSTLADAGEVMMTYERFLKSAATLYADRSDWRNPYVSPIHADFRAGFAPTLIQVGTKEILLSDSIRLYRAIDSANGTTVLDVYEGMPHVFQNRTTLPESKLAIDKSAKFLRKHFGL